MSAGNPKLEAALRAKPDDLEVWSIYGDWLETEGDPRGAWIGLMLAREAASTTSLAKAERAFFEANKQWLLGPELLKSHAEVVWRRGFLFAASVSTSDALQELLTHPSALFVEHVTLGPMNNEMAERWSTQIVGAGWRSVRARHPLNIEAVLALPAVRQLELDLPYEDPPEYQWSAAKSLEVLTLHRASIEVLERLLSELPPRLRELRLEGFEDSALETIAGHAKTPQLALIRVDGEITSEGLAALRVGKRPAKLVLALASDSTPLDPDEIPFATSYRVTDGPETAFVVLDSPRLGPEERAVLERLALSSRCKQLVAFVAPVRFGSRTVTVCRFHSDDDSGAMLPVVLADALSKPRRLRTAAIAISDSNDLVRGLVFGGPISEPPVGKRARPRVELAAVHKVEGSNHVCGQVVRDVLDRMIGFDPGTDAVEAMLGALDEAVGVVLHGPPITQLPPMLTDEPATPEPEEADEDEFGDEDEEADWEDPYDLEVSPEDPLPVDVERKEEPSRIDLPLATQAAVAAADEEDEDDDEEAEEELDEDAEPDAVDASPEEIWNEGPVDPEEDWAEEPIEDPINEDLPDPDQLVPDQIEPTITSSCARCGTPAETLACRLCNDELCETCMPVDEARPRDRQVCPQCVLR